MTDELLIFVGYSDDAKGEAQAVRELEPQLQDTLNRLNEVAASHSKYVFLKIFNWDYDARLGVGGQSYAISPELERAAVTVFVFKERIGRVTWKELTECRERKKENRIPVIAFFSQNHQNPERMNLLEVSEAWSDLLRKKKELTEDWCEDNSRSVTPLETYRDRDHLKQILFKKLEDILPSLIRAENKTRDGYESCQSIPHLNELTSLDQITDQTEYSSQAVLNLTRKSRQ
ncbi:MAG: hypothetical protein LC803_20885 [Acidobacteria bacterium]|nr:hypothetical protein [Acidobacteriota bacterium]